MKDKIIYVIRHANTPGNEQKLFYGSTDLPITETGRQEVVCKRDKGLYPELTNPEGCKPKDASCFTSGMLRTEQTFKLIYGDTPHEAIPDLREIELGPFEMKTFEEVLATPDGKDWINGEVTDFDFEGGDSYTGFYQRVRRGLDTLREEDNFRTIAVIHGAVICAIMETLFPGIQENMFGWTPDPSTGYKISFIDGEPASYERIGVGAEDLQKKH